MAYRIYQGGLCQYSKCQESLGLIEVEGGRSRLYCSPRCRQAAFRESKQNEKRYQILSFNTELRDYWQEHNIEGALLITLQDILVAHGKQAAKLATDAALLAIRLERKYPGRIEVNHASLLTMAIE